jgi:hypothetical protein
MLNPFGTLEGSLYEPAEMYKCHIWRRLNSDVGVYALKCDSALNGSNRANG